MRRISIDALNGSPDEVFRLAELLGSGGIAALPTDTHYALAADPLHVDGVERVFAAKGRDDGKPLPVLFGLRSHLDRLGVHETPETLDRYFGIWPAPLTAVFRIREPIAASRGQHTVAVRLPAEKRVRLLLEAVGPLTGTSANRSGGVALDDPDAVEALFDRSVDVLVDGGRSPGGRPSTIVDATTDPPTLLRAGAFPWPMKE